MHNSLLALQRTPQKIIALAETRYLPRQDSTISMKRAVVKIAAEFPGNAKGTSYSTGWVIKREGNKAWIVTNSHVVFDFDTSQKGENLQVELYYGNTLLGIPLSRLQKENVRFVNVSTDKSLDLALLEVTGLPLDIESLSIADQVQDEDQALVIGNSESKWSTNSGRVIDATSEGLLTLEVNLAGGGSGSPVIVKNKVIGVIFRSSTVQETSSIVHSYAIPIRLVTKQVNDWGVRLP